MINTSPDTGIRFGVIACNSLNQDLVQDLFYGSQATDLSYKAAYDEAKAQAEHDYECMLEDAKIAAAETDYHMLDSDLESWVWDYFDQQNRSYDREEFVDQELERFSDICQIEEPTIKGVLDGVSYEIGWLGGAPLLWVLDGPEGNARQLCSPCVPNAANLDGGFVLDCEIPVGPDGYPTEDHDNGFPCYCVPRDWINKE